MESGIFYGVGTGPGDPELMTLKAVRLINENEVIAIPGKRAQDSAALRIAAGAAPGIEDKEILPLYMPMSSDEEIVRQSHERAAIKVEEVLKGGRNVVFLVLGDPMIYSTYSYLKSIIEKDGFETQTVSGVTSFCAAAARAGVPIAQNDEQIHIIPAFKEDKIKLDYPGNYVIMKSGRKMDQVRGAFIEGGYSACAVENCGMENEMVYRSLEEIPDQTGYFSVVIAKPE